MNMKTLAVLVLMGLSLAALAEDTALTPEQRTAIANAEMAERQNRQQREAEDLAKKQQDLEAKNIDTGNIYEDCNKVEELSKDAATGESVKATPKYKECIDLKKITAAIGEGNFAPVNAKDTIEQSLDKTISCKKTHSYTFDYDKCVSAIAAYNFVVNAESAMNLTQTVRTQNKNKNIQAEASKQVATGDTQTAALDSAIESNKHQKQMQQEKAAAYAMAVAALVNAYRMIPTASDAANACGGKACEKTVKVHEKKGILANQSAKAALVMAISTFTAKGIAAGIAMKSYDNAAQQIAKAKAPYEEEGDDLMMDRCAFNPTDPLCLKAGNRVAGTQYRGGEFTLGGDGASNAFNMTPESDLTPELGAETNLDGETVASMNSPFVDDAKEAKAILNPAAAAQMQAGGPGAGGGGGAGGGMGGGGASLGSDLAGAEKDANKEASIKANKVSGNYNSAGGGGYAGIRKGKEDANPFASLFDAKSNGGIEEDRSIASGDIDGEASGLFQKISKRYGQIQADKRIEANNLE